MVLSSYVGASVRRKEDPRLITGSSTYVDDIKLSGMTHAVFVRSSYAHAKIKGIDKSAALAMPGVIDVMDGEELRSILKDFYGIEPAGDTALEVYDKEVVEHGDIYVPKVQPLAIGKVRYIGDPIAAVVADSCRLLRRMPPSWSRSTTRSSKPSSIRTKRSRTALPSSTARSRTTSACAKRAFTAMWKGPWLRPRSR